MSMTKTYGVDRFNNRGNAPQKSFKRVRNIVFYGSEHKCSDDLKGFTNSNSFIELVECQVLNRDYKLEWR